MEGLFDRGEDALVETQEVHLVDSEDDVADPHHGDDAAVAPGLGEHTLAGVD